MSEMMVSAPNARRGANERPQSASAKADRQTPWQSYVFGLESSRDVAFMPTGAVLTEGRVYIDLLQPCRGPFRALHGQMAGSRNRYVAQEDVPPTVWYALIEHCACVDSETGAIIAGAKTPTRRRRSAKRSFAV